MNRRAHPRLVVAAGLSLGGALLAVLAGMAEVALFVVPWMVVCTMGASVRASARQYAATADIDVDRDRVLVDEDVTVFVRVLTERPCRVRVTSVPTPGFLPIGEDVSGPVDASPGTDAVLARSGSVVAPLGTDAVLARSGPTAPLGTDSIMARSGPSADSADQIRFDLRSTSWGTHDLGTIAVEVIEPFGLATIAGRLAARRPVRVHPTPQQLTELLTPWFVRRVAGTHQSQESARGIEYADLRPFTSGDSVRDINWRASARSDDLLVSQRHPDRASDVVLLVDSFVESGHDARSVFGRVVEAAVGLAESHLAATDRVGMIEFGGLVRWVTPGVGPVQLQRLTDALLATGLYATAADKELPILPPRALPARSFVVALTPLLDSRFIDAIVAARGRGHDVAVIACEPDIGPTQAADSAAHRLALRIWRAERTMLCDRLADHGIAVAPWHAGEPFALAVSRLGAARRVVRIGGAAHRVGF